VAWKSIAQMTPANAAAAAELEGSLGDDEHRAFGHEARLRGRQVSGLLRPAVAGERDAKEACVI